MSTSFNYSTITHPSPVSPSSQAVAAGSGQANKQHIFEQRPLSPPLSISASHINASLPSSPHSPIFTPHSAPLMSAQTSQQGFTPASLSPIRDNIPSKDEDGDVNMDGQDPPRTSHKHRLEEDIEDISEPNKRQRTDHDRDNEPLSSQSIAPLYKLGTSPIPMSRPHTTNNLFDIYSLSSIAASVARTDVKTGEKINVLKKSYKGKIKDLSGKARAVSKPGELRGLLDYPDEEWQIQREMGKELVKYDAHGLVDESHDPAEAIMSKLGDALKMQPGKLSASEDDSWKSFLGYDEPPVVKPSNILANNKPAKPAIGLSVQSGQGAGKLAATVTAPQPVQRTKRPERSGAKRQYHDGAFEGYSGDEAETDAEDDRSGPRRKRKKSNPPSAASSPRFAYATSTTPSVGVGTYAGR